MKLTRRRNHPRALALRPSPPFLPRGIVAGVSMKAAADGRRERSGMRNPIKGAEILKGRDDIVLSRPMQAMEAI